MAIVQILEAEGDGFRVFQDEDSDQLWFHGAEVCGKLGFSNPTTAIQRNVWPEFRQKGVIGRGNPAWFISEEGVHQLIYRAEPKKAVLYQQKFLREILPLAMAQQTSVYYAVFTYGDDENRFLGQFPTTEAAFDWIEENGYIAATFKDDPEATAIVGVMKR
jgi:prophage antirepressor-like protein